MGPEPAITDQLASFSGKAVLLYSEANVDDTWRHLTIRNAGYGGDVRLFETEPGNGNQASLATIAGVPMIAWQADNNTLGIALPASP